MPFQQGSQIGTEERRGSGKPQRAQEAGRRAQPRASAGLRRTRTTARQREVSDGGISNARLRALLRKTHLKSRRRLKSGDLRAVYAARIAARNGQISARGAKPAPLLRLVDAAARRKLNLAFQSVMMRNSKRMAAGPGIRVTACGQFTYIYCTPGPRSSRLSSFFI